MRPTSPALMLFAAGFGTRMQPLTLDRPKPLIHVAGRALIDHTLDLARAIQPRTIVANLHYKAEMLEQHLAGTDVSTITEDPDILDTGGGLKNALPLLGSEPVLTANTDALWFGPNPFEQVLKAWNPAQMDGLLICVPLENTIGRAGGGDFDISGDGHLSRGGNYVYGGISIIKTDRLLSYSEPKFSLNRLWNDMHDADRLFGLVYDGDWCDVGTPDGIPLAEDRINHG